MTDHQLGTTCDRCGVHHRVVESMPKRAFDPEDVARLDGKCEFVRGVAREEPTNTLVVSTTRATRLLRRSTAHGWVVDRERPHDDAKPRAVGISLFAEAAPDAVLSGEDARTVLGLSGTE